MASPLLIPGKTAAGAMAALARRRLLQPPCSAAPLPTLFCGDLIPTPLAPDVPAKLPGSIPPGGSIELMAVPKKKVSRYKKRLRNGPKALKPIPVIVRCLACGRVKLPHYYCCSGNRGNRDKSEPSS